MKFFYCMYCQVVAAFNVFDIRKHGLEKPEDKTCPVCHSEHAYLEVASA